MAQYPERIPRTASPDGFRAENLPASRSIAVITGASRDIGAALATKFSSEGIIVVGNHRDEKKDKRNGDIRSIIEGGGGELQVGDITTLGGRKGLVDAVDKRGGKLDVLVLNAANNSRELNVDANLALIAEMQDRINPGGVIIYMQSVPSHFHPAITGSFIPLYEPVASTKHEAEMELRKRQQELEQRGIKLLFVCPPEVPDTSNVTLFNRRYEEDSQKSGELSRNLGLPISIASADIAEKVFDLIHRKDELPSGYIEFFNGVEDAQTALEKWYKPAQVGIQTLEHTKRDGRPVAIGRTIISRGQVDGVRSLHMVDSFAADEDGSVIGKLRVTPQHAEGHLNTDNGFPLIFAGHKQIRAALETIVIAEAKQGRSNLPHLTGFKLATFERAVLANGSRNLVIKPIMINRTEDGAVYDVLILDAETGRVTTRIEKMLVSYDNAPEEDILPKDFIVEAAAQTAGMAFLPTESGISSDVMPIFRKVGPARFTGVTLKPGATVEYLAYGTGDEKGIHGEIVEVTSQGEDVAIIENIDALVARKDLAYRLIGYKKPTA